MIFLVWLVFVTQGVDFKQNKINIFCLTDKITFKTYVIKECK